MRTIITCGPSCEPIDEVRRITNFSTGELGILLANRLAAAGHEVLCFKGIGAVCPLPVDARAQVIPFSTNEALLEGLGMVEDRAGVDAVFHAAALCDFKVARVSAEDHSPLAMPKISSREGAIHLVLVPARKLIGELRPLFPSAQIIAWKYELNGSRESALAKAQAQLAENATDGCVVNGAAYGPGFGVLGQNGEFHHVADKAALCDFLANRVGAMRSPLSSE